MPKLVDGAGTETGTNTNPLKISDTAAIVPATGGFYSVTGKSGTAAIAASLATDTTLMAMRFNPGSSRKAYINKVRILYGVVTVGTSGLVPGVLGIQKITTAVPTGGAARTVIELDAASLTTDMQGVNDNSAALTPGATVFTDEISWYQLPIVITGANSGFEFVFEPGNPLVLLPGDGIVLRTRQACPGTQTWYFTYRVDWTEK